MDKAEKIKRLIAGAGKKQAQILKELYALGDISINAETGRFFRYSTGQQGVQEGKMLLLKTDKTLDEKIAYIEPNIKRLETDAKRTGTVLKGGARAALDKLYNDKKQVEDFYNAQPTPAPMPQPTATPSNTERVINYTWETLPADAKKITLPKKVDYKPSPTDENLLKILKPFHAHDDIRPIMSGINFDDDNIVATDSFKLVLLPNKSDYRGVFSTGITEKIGDRIDGRYPNYPAVIPYDNPIEGIITVENLYRYVVAGKKATRSIFAIFPYEEYKSNPGPAICFNAEFLINCLKLFLQLGIKKIRIQYSMPNRPVIMFPAENKTWKDKLVLLMPLFLQESDYTGEVIEGSYGAKTIAAYGMFNKNYVPKGKPDVSAIDKIERNFITAYDLLNDVMINPGEAPAAPKVDKYVKDNTKDQYYIEFLNKEKNFTKDAVYFSSFDDAKKWGKENLEKFSSDMINFAAAEGTNEPPTAERKPKEPTPAEPTPAPAPAAEPPAEEKPKRQLSYLQQVTLLKGKLKAKGRKLTEAEVIAEGLKLHEARKQSAQTADEKRDGKKRLSPTTENLLRWAANPGDFELIGVDTFERTDPTADYQRTINKQKILNLYGIKA